MAPAELSDERGIMPPMNPPDSLLGFITGPSVNIGFMDSVFSLFMEDPNRRFNFSRLVIFGPYIHQNRSQMQDEFMNSDRDWLFVVDNDIIFSPADVWALFREADKRGPGIYSGPYVLENGFMVCGTWDDQIEVAYHNLLALPENPAEIGMVGMGFTLIHREVFEAVGPNSFEPYPGPTGLGAGEDVSFCWRARLAGYTPVLVPECNPGHFKQVTVYPHQMVRNAIGDEVGLVMLNEELRNLSFEKLREEVNS